MIILTSLSQTMTPAAILEGTSSRGEEFSSQVKPC